MSKPIETYCGIDGEGKGRNPHLYTLLAMSTEFGESRYVENENGLSSVESLEFLVSLTDITPVVFSFAFLYDITKIVENLPDKSIYRLLRPELRPGPKGRSHGRKLINYRGFRLDYHASCFDVSNGKKRLRIWDVFKFYQQSFVKALSAWEIGDADERKFIEEMKLRRSDDEFYSDPLKVRSYCIKECQLLAKLVHRLVDTHADVNLPLPDFYGAGSTASVILEKLEIHTKNTPPPDHIAPFAMCAFFGGRFENSVIGDIPGPVYNYDISSAYPYQLYRMPCLEHGTWDWTSDIDVAKSATASLIWWHLGPADRSQPWGPYPFRADSGAILFPIGGGVGWTWKEEFFQGKAMFSNVEFLGAYVYHTRCDCRPFHSLPIYYRERVRIGKSAKGIPLKLGPNACYGKIAQSVGTPKYANWVWAGMTTSNTRAMGLRAMAQHKNRANLKIVATDGIYTTERLSLDIPENTDTYDLPKPLGGWEEEIIESGMFAARPGVNFPLDMSDARPDDVKGRGFGRKALYDNAARIRAHWYEHGINKPIMLPDIGRFYGAKTSIWQVGQTYKRASCYGTWYSYEPYLSFNPLPKRVGVRQDGTLIPHVLDYNMKSTAYRDEFTGLYDYMEDINDENYS